MCCIQPPPESVSDTRIFAADSRKREGNQFIVYQMSIEASDDVAMTLPIPVIPQSTEDAVRFISLEDYPEFFSDLKKGFPSPRKTNSFSGGFGGSGRAADLEVKEVGSFEASFVPTFDDFNRLDKRFRIPRRIWDQIRGYSDYGFVVFQLKPERHRHHPMAFEFPRRSELKQLFFPTVHIHDGEYHGEADFDHELYAQISEPFGHEEIMHWRESPLPADRFMKIRKASGIVSRHRHVYMKTIKGRQRNEDTWV